MWSEVVWSVVCGLCRCGLVPEAWACPGAWEEERFPSLLLGQGKTGTSEENRGLMGP